MIVGITGYARVGKDALASAFVDQLNWTRHGFADALRDVLYALNPIVVVEDGTCSMQRLVDTHGWEVAKDTMAGSPYGTRSLLQRLGTEGGRKILGDNIWIDTLMRKVDNPDHSFVVPDVRFPNEADAIVAAGGIIVKVHRPGCGPANTHASETSMDSYWNMAHVHNVGTIDDLLDAALAFIPNIRTTEESNR